MTKRKKEILVFALSVGLILNGANSKKVDYTLPVEPLTLESLEENKREKNKELKLRKRVN